jgi:hypothetical protein
VIIHPPLLPLTYHHCRNVILRQQKHPGLIVGDPGNVPIAIRSIIDPISA